MSYDVNRGAVYHSIETEGGDEDLASFCTIMNMPCISGEHTRSASFACDKKRLRKSYLQVTNKEKKRWQG